MRFLLVLLNDIGESIVCDRRTENELKTFNYKLFSHILKHSALAYWRDCIGLLSFQCQIYVHKGSFRRKDRDLGIQETLIR
jgi:hypothetical protein